MPAVAEVQFKATNSQQVVTAFKSVGTAAQDSTTKIQQNSGAMKTMGQGMKNSMGGIAQVGTAFATLSLSVVNTWRAYRDLGDAQLKVDRANTKLAKSEEKLNDLKAKAEKLQKAGAKGGLESQRRSIDLEKARKKLAETEKQYGKNSLEAADARLAVSEAEAEGSKTGGELEQVLKDIALQEEVVANNTFAADEAQEAYNDTQQDFYLSILPTALSGLASLSLAFGGVKNALTGPGGLIGAFKFLGPIGLIVGGLFLAFKTNFLGIKDLVTDLIGWVKERFGVWKQTLEEVFGFIQKGDWAGAFNRIKQAAVDFWNDLVRTVPFFGGINKVVDAIRKGDWAGAFAIITTALSKWWEDVKSKVPLLADVEKFFRDLFSGNWAGAWKDAQTIINGILVGIFGKEAVEGFRLRIQKGLDTAKAEFGLFKDSIKPDIAKINEGLAQLGKGDWAGGFSTIWTGLDAAIGKAIARINDWVKLNFGVDLSLLATKAGEIGTKILTGIMSGLTFIAHTVIDPILVKLLDPAAWAAALAAIGSALLTIGKSIITALLGYILNDSKSKATSKALGDIGAAIWAAIVNWMETNLPDTTEALRTFARGFVDAIRSTVRYFTIGGMEIWNAFIMPFKQGMLDLALGGTLAGPILKAMGISAEQIKSDPKFKDAWTFDIQAELDKAAMEDVLIDLERKKEDANNKLKQNPVKVPATVAPKPTIQEQLKAQLAKVQAQKAPEVKVPVGADPKVFNQAIENLDKNVRKRGPSPMQIGGNTAPVEKKVQDARTKIQTAPPVPMDITAQTTKAVQKYEETKKKVQTPISIPVEAKTQSALNQINNLKRNAGKPLIIPVFFQVRNSQAVAQGRAALGPRNQGLGGRVTQHGYMGTVKRPTLFLAGEGGRPEDVSVIPRGSGQQGGTRAGGAGGAGRYIWVGPIYLDGEQVMGKTRYKMNENQAIFK